jgi:hypothetical protein
MVASVGATKKIAKKVDPTSVATPMPAADKWLELRFAEKASIRLLLKDELERHCS